MMKKILCFLCAACLLTGCLFAFAACGDDNKLVMATNATFPPYEFLGEDGETIVGIDAEIAKAIADKLGMELVIKDVDFDTIIAGVQGGNYDIGMAGMTVTDERKQSVNFSTSYAKGVQVVIVPENSPYADLDDFFNLDAKGNWVSVKDGVKIGVQQGTTGDIYASDTVEKWGFGEENVTQYKTGPDAIQALKAGKISAVIIDKEPAKSYVAANAGLRIMETSYADEDYAIAVNKNDTELLEKINKALKELTEDGTIAAIVEKYIPSK